MKLSSILQITAALAGLAAANIAEATARNILHERIADPESLVEVSIGLHPESRDLLERTLYEISNPHHANYLKHLTREEARDLLKPSLNAANAVKHWLLEEGVSDFDIRDNGLRIRAHVPAGLAARLSGTDSDLATRDGIANEGAVIPILVRDHIATLQVKRDAAPEYQPRSAQRMSSLGTRSHKSHGKGGNNEEVDLENCETELTPACLRKIYRMPTTPAKPHPKNLLGVVGFIGQAAQYDQLELFTHRFDPYSIGGNFSVALVNGGKNPQGYNFSAGEANLDIQYAIAMGFNVSTQYISVGGDYLDIIPDLDLPEPVPNAVEPLLALTEYLVDLPDDELPTVVSISYGVNEQLYHKSYARRVCDQFGQLGTRGVSILVASGDFGPGQSCQANDKAKSTRFIPGFPESCPYVTAVGATEGIEGVSHVRPANFSGGGFSEYFDRPKWQDKAVKSWLNKHGKKWEKYYNARGRAFPDVSTLGVAHQIFSHDAVETAGGTSASTPVFAGMIALINNYRLEHGKAPMGFLNPWLYSIGDLAFTDITKGKTVGCQGESYSGLPAPVIPAAGFEAVKGWDPATGLGTPLFDRMKQLACR